MRIINISPDKTAANGSGKLDIFMAKSVAAQNK